MFHSGSTVLDKQTSTFKRMVSSKPSLDQSCQDNGNVSLQGKAIQRCGSAKIYLEEHPLENKSVTDYLGVELTPN